jgi:hypothetical protein
MKSLFIATLCAICFCFLATGQKSQLIEVDYQKLISNADLFYNKPATRSEAGQPIGNGKMGSLIWTTPQSLRFQINRVDIFGNNSATNNFYQRNTDYCGGAGFVDIDFQSNEDIFTNGTFRQHLSCYDGTVTTEGRNVKTTSLVWSELDVMVVRIEDSRSKQTPVVANLRTLRHPITRRGDHSAISKVEVIGDKIILTQEFTEGDYYNKSAVAISMPNNNARAWIAHDTEVKLSSEINKKEFTILVSSAATFDPEFDVVNKVIQQLEKAESEGFEGVLEASKEWWHSYWEKSLVQLNSDNGVADYIEKYYTYYLYLMGSTSRGDYPVKFNGMLWTTEGDRRAWGGFYWGANQSCLYDALFVANRIELLDPMFNMYSNMRESCEVAASQIWGSKGIWIPETVGFDGLPEIPEHIVSQMRQLYLQNQPLITNTNDFKQYIDYASRKVPHHSLWNWKADDGWKDGEWHFKDKGHGFVGHVMHIFSRGAKLAYLYWMKYEFTQDEKWLADYAYPMIKGIAEFYRNYPNVKKAEDGKYHIYHVNDNESVWGGMNTAEEISSMMGILPVAIKASEILNIDGEMRPVWSEFLENLAPFTLSSDNAEMAGPTTFVRSLNPVLQGPASGRPDGNTMPQWCFDLITLESENLELMEIANNTYDTYYSQGINEESNVGILSMLPVAGTLMGRTEVTEFLIPNQIRMGGNGEMENRMHLREGAQTTTAQRLGRAAHALHNALCQSVPPRTGEPSVIHVFPAWPENWNAKFKLYSRGNFLVSSSFQEGNVEFVEIKSQSGEVCQIRNPWKEDVVLYVDGKENETLTGSLLEFSTKLNSSYIILKKGTTLNQFKD